MIELFRGALLVMATMNFIFTAVAINQFKREHRKADLRVAVGIGATEFAIMIGQVINRSLNISIATVLLFIGMAILLSAHLKYDRTNMPA